MDADSEVYVLGWADIELIVRSLAESVDRDGRADVVVGVVRGGWVPAVLLAHLLRMRDVRALEVTHTTQDSVLAAKSPHPRVTRPESLGDLRGADVVIVDDVVGSGSTVATTQRLVRAAGATRIRTAVCVLNETNWSVSEHRATELTYVGSRRPGWVVFPWELT